MEYDPLNKLKHTTYWYETNAADEWPLSANGQAEAAVDREGTPASLDPTVGPTKFYFTLETTGALEPREVVLNGLEKLEDKLVTLKRELEQSSAGPQMPPGSVWAGMQGAQSVWGGAGAGGGWQ